MKRWLMIVFIFQGFAFIGITIYKYLPGPLAVNNQKNPAEKEGKKSDVVLFWQYYNDATDYRTSGKYVKALKNYNSALNIRSSHENSLYYLGNMYMVTGNFEAAKSTWEKLIEVNPSSARGHFQLGTIYSYKVENNNLYNLQRAAKHFRKTSQLNQEITGPLLELAKIQILKNNRDSAMHTLNDVVTSNFRSVEALFLQGYLAWKNGNPGKAKTLLKKSVAIKEGSDPAGKNVGEGNTKKGGSPLESGSGKFNLFSAQIDLLMENLKGKSGIKMDNLYNKFAKKAGLSHNSR